MSAILQRSLLRAKDHALAQLEERLARQVEESLADVARVQADAGERLRAHSLELARTLEEQSQEWSLQEDKLRGRFSVSEAEAAHLRQEVRRLDKLLGRSQAELQAREREFVLVDSQLQATRLEALSRPYDTGQLVVRRVTDAGEMERLQTRAEEAAEEMRRLREENAHLLRRVEVNESGQTVALGHADRQNQRLFSVQAALAEAVEDNTRLQRSVEGLRAELAQTRVSLEGERDAATERAVATLQQANSLRAEKDYLSETQAQMSVAARRRLRKGGAVLLKQWLASVAFRGLGRALRRWQSATFSEAGYAMQRDFEARQAALVEERRRVAAEADHDATHERLRARHAEEVASRVLDRFVRGNDARLVGWTFHAWVQQHLRERRRRLRAADRGQEDASDQLARATREATHLRHRFAVGSLALWAASLRRRSTGTAFRRWREAALAARAGLAAARARRAAEQPLQEMRTELQRHEDLYGSRVRALQERTISLLSVVRRDVFVASHFHAWKELHLHTLLARTQAASAAASASAAAGTPGPPIVDVNVELSREAVRSPKQTLTPLLQRARQVCATQTSFEFPAPAPPRFPARQMHLSLATATEDVLSIPPMVPHTSPARSPPPPVRNASTLRRAEPSPDRPAPAENPTSFVDAAALERLLGEVYDVAAGREAPAAAAVAYLEDDMEMLRQLAGTGDPEEDALLDVTQNAAEFTRREALPGFEAFSDIGTVDLPKVLTRLRLRLAEALYDLNEVLFKVVDADWRHRGDELRRSGLRRQDNLDALAKPAAFSREMRAQFHVALESGVAATLRYRALIYLRSFEALVQRGQAGAAPLPASDALSAFGDGPEAGGSDDEDGARVADGLGSWTVHPKKRKRAKQKITGRLLGQRLATVLGDAKQVWHRVRCGVAGVRGTDEARPGACRKPTSDGTGRRGRGSGRGRGSPGAGREGEGRPSPGASRWTKGYKGCPVCASAPGGTGHHLGADADSAASGAASGIGLHSLRARKNGGKSTSIRFLDTGAGPREFWLAVTPAVKVELLSAAQLEEHMWRLVLLVRCQDRSKGLRLGRHEAQRRLLDYRLFECSVALLEKRLISNGTVRAERIRAPMDVPGRGPFEGRGSQPATQYRLRFDDRKLAQRLRRRK